MTRTELKRAYRVNSVIGAAMIATIFIYAGIVEYLKAANAPFDGFVKPLPPVAQLRIVLLAVAVVIFVLIKIIWRQFMQGKFKIRPRHGAASPVAPFMSVSVVVFALCESICIYGLVLFLIAGNTLDFYTFFAISLLAYVIYFPRYAQMEEWAKRQGLIEEGEAGRRETVFE